MESEIFYIASIVGGVAFGLSGFLIGVRKNFDIMGLFILAMLTANGGGVVRDVLVGKTPTILVDITGFLLICGLMCISLVFKIHKFDGIERRLLFVISDSVGLVAFSITGALVGINEGLNIFGVMTLSFLTATGGGIIRDIFVNEVPELLSSGFYGSVAVLVAIILFFINEVLLMSDVLILMIFIVALATRLIAHFYDWHLPKL